MIDLVEGVIVKDGQKEPISNFVVEFLTPFGYAATLDEAKKWCEEAGLLDRLAIKPVVVVVGTVLRENVV